MNAALERALEEIAEIEWSEGLISMPPHLIAQGTKTLRYTHKVVIDQTDIHVHRGLLTEESHFPTSIIQHTIKRLSEPIVEVYVWGEKQ